MLARLDEILDRSREQLDFLVELRRTVSDIKRRIVAGGSPLLPRHPDRNPRAPKRGGIAR